MNLYVRIMNEVIDYIEENIHEPLTLQSISEKFYISQFHFSRLFKIITGLNLKHYIIGRKLTTAAKSLRAPENTVTKTAFDYGFEYPEVFSRAFKKQFGISPSSYKKRDYPITEIPKASVIERNITNFKGTFTIKENIEYLNSFQLKGTSLEVNEYSNDFADTLNTVGGEFFNRYSDYFEDSKLYSVVNCHGDASGEYTVFFGGHISCENDLDSRSIPEGWYACFGYYGEMLDLRGTFVNDLYQWIMMREIELSSNNIGMINIYDKQDLRNVRILVPIKYDKYSK